MQIIFHTFMLFSVLFAFPKQEPPESFYDFKVKDIQGNDFDFSTLKGKKVIVVNTASKCGFTPQYEDLQKLYEEYRDSGLVIIGFPANDFLRQEPANNEDIETFCRVNYGVTFPMMSKISVKGKDIHPVYKWLTRKKLNGVMNTRVSWNFQKYMVDEHGRISGIARPQEKPYADKIISWLNES